jgi:glutamine amidotransferase-like uncharacterized protein
MKKNVIYIILLTLLSNVSFGKTESIDVAIYSDDGTWADGIIALEKFIEWKGLTHQRILSDDINNGILSNGYKIVIFPGGYANDYKVDLLAKGEKNIKAFVNAGGGYLGICAGAFLATSTVIWEGSSYYYPLDLFQGTATGSINEIKPWAGYAMTSISLNKYNPINKFQKEKLNVLYYGGPYFEPSINQTIDTIATWDDYNNKLAIIGFKYGAGNVILSGPHPEIEESDIRDGNDFGNELIDECSEWGWLWSAFDKLLNQEITDSLIKTRIDYSINESIDYSIYLDKNSETLYSKNDLQFNFQIFNIEGDLLLDTDFYKELNISKFASGLYICRSKYATKSYAQNIILIK